MSPSMIVSMLAYLFLAIVALIPLWDGWADFSKRKKIWIIFCAIGFLIFGIWDVCNRFFEGQKSTNEISNKIDNSAKKIENQASVSTGQIIDTLSKINATVKEGHTPKKSNKPLRAYLRLKPADIPNPGLEKDPNGDSIILRYATANYGSGNAFNIVSSDFFVEIKNGIIAVQKKINVLVSNPSYIIYADSREYYSNDEGIIYKKGVYSDSTFWCLKIDYDDDSKKRKSYIKIFHANIKELSLTEVGGETFEKIEKYLILKKIWKSPLKQ